ncbi:hypothetical protein EEB14_37255 [Rhodococcus sp. WS4]|nr:hypothetical protein EEB14_37255 [Rhodococcus sp. WS4]
MDKNTRGEAGADQNVKLSADDLAGVVEAVTGERVTPRPVQNTRGDGRRGDQPSSPTSLLCISLVRRLNYVGNVRLFGTHRCVPTSAGGERATQPADNLALTSSQVGDQHRAGSRSGRHASRN